MSRHRNVRSMNYDEDYEGYDDVYGHSVEESDFCVSPSTAAQFMFDRTRNDPLSNFVSPSNHPIVETNEDEDDDYEETTPSLSDSSAGLQQTLSALDRAKLNSCIEAMQNIMGETTPESVMVAAALQTGFDPNAATDFIMNQMETPKPQRSTRNRQPRIVRSSGKDQVVVAAAAGAQSSKPPSAAAVAEISRRQEASAAQPTKSQPQVETPSSAGKKSVISSKGDSKSTTVDGGTSKGKSSKVESGGASADTTSKSKPPRESGALGDVVTPKSKPTKDAYEDHGVNSNEFADVGADESVAATSKKDLLLETSLAATPGQLHKSASRAKMDRLDVQKEYEKRKAGGKDYINLVVIGHVDAGKSTLMGHVLYQLGFVNKRTMHKYEQDSKKIGKGSFAFAWVLDETEEERSRGVTMDIAQTRFETRTKVVTLLDAPGHKDFIPNMITGAAQADVAVLVINATRGEFETGFEMGGQTREHAMLVRSLGVSQLLVAVNKMDTVSWSQERYDEVVKKLGSFLKQAGFRESELSFIPCSGLNGENLTKASQDKQLTSWYKGPSLVDQIDEFRPPERPIIDKPFRMCLSDVFKGMGAGFSVGGIIQAGNIQTGDRVTVIPAAETAIVKNIAIDDATVGVAFAGDNVILTLTGVDIINTSIGSILCDPLNPIEATTRFRARIVIFNIDVPITQGFPVVLHYQSVSEQAHIKRLVSQLNKSTGEVIKRKPRCLVKNTNAIVDILVDRPICIELYREFKELGRFMLRSSGSTIAAGIVVEILREKSEANGTS